MKMLNKCNFLVLRLQSFAIPGSIFLTILSGYLFPFPVALALVCLVSVILLLYAIM